MRVSYRRVPNAVRQIFSGFSTVTAESETRGKYYPLYLR